MIKSTDNVNSRYVQGGETDIYQDRLGWWERRQFLKDADDIDFVIEPIYNMRPSKLLHDFYGNSEKMFLILQYNNIVDITTEFVTGAKIKLPTKDRVKYNMFNKQRGGNVINEDL